MKVMVISGLKDFAGDKTLAVVAFDAKLTLIIFLAVRESILSHVLSVQEGVASNTLETPDVPLRVQRNQGLAFNDFLGAAGALRR